MTDLTLGILNGDDIRHGISEATRAADYMRSGLDHALSDPATRTPDIRGTGRLDGMIAAILSGIEMDDAHAQL